MKMNGKIALVTGSERGLGRGIALKLAEHVDCDPSLASGIKAAKTKNRGIRFFGYLQGFVCPSRCPAIFTNQGRKTAVPNSTASLRIKVRSLPHSRRIPLPKKLLCLTNLPLDCQIVSYRLLVE